MKLLSLIARNLSRRMLRTSLSVFALFIAGFLFCVLIAVPASIDRIVGDASRGIRVIVSQGNSYMLPVWYRDDIKKMPHVMGASAERQWGGRYQNDPQPIVTFGLDEDIQEVYPESNLSPDQVKEFLRDRRAALVGTMLMDKYHWHVGQIVTLKNGDSKLTLDFLITGVQTAKLTQNSFIFQRAYFDEAIKKTFKVDIANRADFISVRVGNVSDVPKVIEEIDGRFRNSEYETSTITESDSIANGVSAIADLCLSPHFCHSAMPAFICSGVARIASAIAATGAM